MRNMNLILLAGQSNMSGRDTASPEDLTPVPGLLAFGGDGKWRPAVEPVTRDRPMVGCFDTEGKRIVPADPWDALIVPADGKIQGVGPGRTFGKLFHQACPDQETGLIPTSVGGTPLAAWQPGGTDPFAPENHPYDRAVELARAAQKDGVIRAILWHQGETDASRGTPDVKALLRNVICNFRHDLHLPDTVPFLIGELGDFYEERIQKNVPAIHRIFRELASELPSVRVVSAAGLTHRGDRLHFNAESARELGRRYFHAWEEFRKETEK